MRRIATSRRGFSLGELLIVLGVAVILLLILGPGLRRPKGVAREEAHRITLAEVRNALARYTADHDDTLPDLINGWEALIQPHQYKQKRVGPYLKSVPINPWNGLRNVVDGTGASRVDAGFVYDYAAGEGSGTIRATAPDGRTLAAEAAPIPMARVIRGTVP